MFGFATIKTIIVAVVTIGSMGAIASASAIPEANAPATHQDNIAKRAPTPCGVCGGWGGWNGWNGCGNCGGWGGWNGWNGCGNCGGWGGCGFCGGRPFWRK